MMNINVKIKMKESTKMFRKIGKNMLKSMLPAFLIFTFAVTPVFAIELKADVTEDFVNWVNSEESEFAMPRAYNVPVHTEEVEEAEVETKSSLVSGLFKRNRIFNFTPVGASISDSKYNMADYLNLRVENQKSTSQCWAFSTLKSMETNIAKRTGSKNLLNFSERHIDYATSKTFKDGTNPIAYDRELGGGLPLVALSYLTNGTGAVKESDMPFEDNQNKINLSEINKPVDTVVTDYATLPIILKRYEKDAAGNTTSVTYSDSNGKIYTPSELKAIRDTIKKHIVEDGALFSFTAGNKSIYYNIDQSNPTASVFDGTTYNCNNESITRDHAITIVGWDDNYPKENFVEGHRPSTNGAYIVLNSYGEESFDNGYLHISYEDALIESECYCVTGTHAKDYNNIYQSDFYGGIYAIGTEELTSGFYGHTFSRRTSQVEYLDSVGITLSDYAKVEIYINTNGDSMNLSKLTKIGGTATELEPGYHRLPVTRTTLKNSQFSIVVKQTETGSDARFYFTVETPVKNTVFANATSDGPSAYSEDGYAWDYFSDLNVAGMDMTKTDVCIKAFTTVEGNQDPDPMKEVTSVVISPSRAEIRPGESKQFTANVYGTNLTPQDTGVTYSIEWNNSINSGIDETGKLTLGVDEEAKTIKVIARSNFDPSKTAIALVTVRIEPANPNPEKEITAFIIDPLYCKAKPGTAVQFSMTIEGNYLTEEDKEVEFTLSNNTSSYTRINAAGLLQIGVDEKAKELFIEVHLKKYPEVKNGARVEMIYPEEPVKKEVTAVTINPLSTSLKPGDTKQFTAKVKGTNLTSEDLGVDFSVIDNKSTNTKISESGLLVVGEDEKASLMKVKAQSKYDPRITAIAYVSVIIDEPEEPNKEFSSTVYKITDNDIYKVMEETSITNFKKNIKSDLSYSIYKDGVVVQDEKTIIQTGMKLKLSTGKEYTLVVRGDINLDGKVTLVDLSKQILHFNETKGFILNGPAVKGADMNYDGEVTLLDISQMLVYFNSK